MQLWGAWFCSNVNIGFCCLSLFEIPQWIASRSYWLRIKKRKQLLKVLDRTYHLFHFGDFENLVYRPFTQKPHSE